MLYNTCIRWESYLYMKLLLMLSTTIVDSVPLMIVVVQGQSDNSLLISLYKQADSLI